MAEKISKHLLLHLLIAKSYIGVQLLSIYEQFVEFSLSQEFECFSVVLM